MNRVKFWGICNVLMAMMLLVSCANYAPEATDLILYTDSRHTDWEDWSWDSTRDFAATTQTHSGAAAIAVTATDGWGALSLRTAAPLTGSDYTSLAFWGYGAAGGTQLAVFVQTGDDIDAPGTHTLTLPAGQWTEIVIPLADLGNPAQIARINWQNDTPVPQPAFYLDDIRLVAKAAPPPPPPDTIELVVDVNAERRAISPDIYGVNEYSMVGDPVALMQELGVSVRRWGGNTTSR